MSWGGGGAGLKRHNPELRPEDKESQPISELGVSDCTVLGTWTRAVGQGVGGRGAAVAGRSAGGASPAASAAPLPLPCPPGAAAQGGRR